jgi:predicted Ser/Thr protein kinase
MVDEGRFPPGTMLAGRYRVAGLLGRGGMGEVYRATDLTLGQAVALKFLPEATARDDRALARFYNEVRIARQVTHPNVCRVYDIGEVDGHRFISMEYVDGEDLGSLLRRIGRLPADKAVETARKLCAGLAAAHEKGVLHRDLKPANVMIDGRGQVIIMDFGLAGLGVELQRDVRSGTPAYMSPEQLAGTEVTTRSDIYALGLLLYEIFTGKRAFEAASVVQLMEMQARATPLSITSVVKDMEPAVEQLILRCLRPDPRDRPSSALAVAAALPGGDPLAAALAAGETPSPYLVAAAGETEGLSRKQALPWLAGALAALALACALFPRFSITTKTTLDIPPDALMQSARSLTASFGYPKPQARAWGFTYNEDYRLYLKTHPSAAAARWSVSGPSYPPVVTFWYRESPQPMNPRRGLSSSVSYFDPGMDGSGRVRLILDPDGRMQEFEASPKREEMPSQPAAPFDWAKLFAAAGLDQSRFQAAEPRWNPQASWDARAAWTGPAPVTGASLRVEAAQWRGKPISFRVTGPWTSPADAGPNYSDPPFVRLFIYLALLSAGYVAWLNLRSGKCDLNGSLRLAGVYFGCMAGARFMAARHAASMAEIDLFWNVVAAALVNGMIMWAMYIALEPWVRRLWPRTIVSWSRLTTAGFRDPLVGRDILYGSAMGCGWALLVIAQTALQGSGSEPLIPGGIQALLGARQCASSMFDAVTNGIGAALLFFFLMFGLRSLLRKEWLAAPAFVIILTALLTNGTAHPWVEWPTTALFAVLYTAAFLRFGLLALMVTGVVEELLFAAPRTMDFSAWYSGTGMLPVVVVGLLIIYGYRVSLAGQKTAR